MGIKFGTSGWRAIIADEFTFENVRFVTQSISNYLKSKNEKNPVIVGYDTRFLSEEFAKLSCEVLAENSINSLYCKNPAPTPVISYEIIRGKLSGGINITASHNPPEYNGLKFSPSWGGPALPEDTRIIEEQYKIISLSGTRGKKKEEIKEIDFETAQKQKLVKTIDPQISYLKRLKELVDFDVIKKAKPKIGIDLFHGTAKGYLDTALENVSKKTFVIHKNRDVLFSGKRPEPDEKGMNDLKEIMKKNGLIVGLACDGDADRFGILDSDLSFISPNQVISLLFYHLIKFRKWKGIAVRSVMTTHLIDAIAKLYNVEVKETPVGFKYIGDIMVSEKTKNDFIIGGEESGGLSIRSHVPEKDGILACLLMLEMSCVEKKSFKEILSEIESKVGKFITKRINYDLTSELMQKVKEKLQKDIPSKISDLKVKNTITLDGYKFVLEDGSWIGIRLSGTEPVVRLYIETNSEQKLNKLKNDSEILFSLKGA